MKKRFSIIVVTVSVCVFLLSDYSFAKVVRGVSNSEIRKVLYMIRQVLHPLLQYQLLRHLETTFVGLMIRVESMEEW